MSEYLVTGIAPNGDVAHVEQMLASLNLDASRLAIVTKAKAGTARADHHGGSGSLSSSSTIMTGSSGTGVPGIGGAGASLSSFVGHGGGTDYLGGLPMIPTDVAQNYNIAIAEGRGLVTYKATPDEAPALEAAFRQAGLRNVKTFKPKVLSS